MNIAAIDAAMEKMNAAWQVASTEMYNAAQSDPNAQQAHQEQPHQENPPKNDNVTDVDFEEVK